MNRILSVILGTTVCISVAAQQRVDLGLTVGTTGVGLELSTPVNDWMSVRAGGTFMPHIEKELHFEVAAKNGKSKYVYDNSLSKKENQIAEKKFYHERFEKLNSLLYSVLGFKAKENVDVIGEPTMNNLKVLADFYPFKENKHWHVTAGFYYGGKRVAKAKNSTEDMTTLLAVQSYNSMYKKALGEEPFMEYNDVSLYNDQISQKLMDFGLITMYVGKFKHDIYATETHYYDHSEVDPVTGSYLRDANKREIKRGEVQYLPGEKMYSEGDAYRMTPNENNVVTTDAIVNAFKPYVGVGYSGYLSKDKRTALSVDMGVLIWGGKPRMVTHDGFDLTRDLTDLNENIERYMKYVRCLPVYPVLEIKFSQQIF